MWVRRLSAVWGRRGVQRHVKDRLTQGGWKLSVPRDASGQKRHAPTGRVREPYGEHCTSTASCSSLSNVAASAEWLLSMSRTVDLGGRRRAAVQDPASTIIVERRSTRSATLRMPLATPPQSQPS